MTVKSTWIRQVDLLSLRIFLAAIDHGQIARAALQENLVASAATKRIQELESLAGVELLKRSPNGVVPSPAGRILADHARSIMATLEALRCDMSDFESGGRGAVTVSSLRWVIQPHMALKIAAFNRNSPGVSLELREETGTPQVIQSLLQGTADLAVFITLPGLELDQFELVKFRKERLVAVVPTEHRLATLPSLRFEDLLTEDFIGFAPPAPLMPALQDLAIRSGGELRLKLSAQSVEVAQSFVRAGLGVTILPGSTLLPETPGILPVYLDESWAACDIVIATVKGRKLRPAAKAFQAHLVDSSTSIQS